MVTGPLANAKILSDYFGYYKTIAKNYILGKEKLLIDICNFTEFEQFLGL